MKKIVLFYDSNFPMDGTKPNETFFQRLKSNVIVSDAHSLKENLRDKNVDGLINLHGPYFPKHAWSAIYNHFTLGKVFVHTGGAPFRIPCYQEDGKWKMERAQTAYHQKLNIHEVLPVRFKPIDTLVHNPDIPVFSDKQELFTIEDTHNFILHVTKASATEKEMGSVGPMDAHIYPLLKGSSEDKRELAAPTVLDAKSVE